MKNKIVYSILALSLISTLSIAEGISTTDVEATYSSKSGLSESKEMKQNINLGFASTTGNTKTLNINGKYDYSYTSTGYNNQALNVAFDSSVFFTKNNNIKDNEEYKANLGLEQFISNGWLGYTSINWLRNKFLNFDNKSAIGAGIGKELYNDEQHSLKVKLGVAYNMEQYSNAQAEHKFTSINEYIEYNNQLNKVSSLFLKIGALENFDNFKTDYEVTGVFGFSFAVAENLSLTIEEEIRYDNLPPIGFKKTDTKSIVRLGYHF